MPDFAELGRKSLPQADLLSAAPERRSLRGVGAAAGDRGGSSRGLQTTAQIVEQWSSPGGSSLEFLKLAVVYSSPNSGGCTARPPMRRRGAYSGNLITRCQSSRPCSHRNLRLEVLARSAAGDAADWRGAIL